MRFVNSGVIFYLVVFCVITCSGVENGNNESEIKAVTQKTVAGISDLITPEADEINPDHENIGPYEELDLLPFKTFTNSKPPKPPKPSKPSSSLSQSNTKPQRPNKRPKPGTESQNKPPKGGKPSQSGSSNQSKPPSHSRPPRPSHNKPPKGGSKPTNCAASTDDNSRTHNKPPKTKPCKQPILNNEQNPEEDTNNAFPDSVQEDTPSHENKPAKPIQPPSSNLQDDSATSTLNNPTSEVASKPNKPLTFHPLLFQVEPVRPQEEDGDDKQEMKTSSS